MHNRLILIRFLSGLFGLVRALCLPFKVIYYGHFKIILCLAAVAGVCLFLVQRGSLALSSCLLALHSQLHLNPGSVNKILPLSQALCWLVLAPLLFTAVVLPTRLIWLHHSLSWLKLCLLTPRQIVACGHALWITVRASFYLLIPAIAMSFLYVAFVRSIYQPVLYVTYSLACCIVCAVTIYRTLPVLMTPFITICGEYAPRQALYLSRAILEERKKELFCGAGIWLGISLITMRFGQFHSRSLDLICLIAWVWYLLTFFSLLTINAVAEYEKKTAVEAPVKAAIFGTSHPQNEPKPSQALKQNPLQDNRPVSVQVTKVWVQD